MVGLPGKSKTMFRQVLILFSFLLSVMTAMSFSLKGRIISAETGEALTGAVIHLMGSSQKTISGLDGSFVLKDLPAGDYQLGISMTGYIKEILNVTVSQNTVGLIVELRIDVKELSDVIVTATKEKGTESGARNLEKKADRVMNIVSARAIEISPDLIVANVIQRVSGVTVERNNTGDGQYALLRGMDKRYNYTLVNGVKIPSPDNKNRFVPLDIFPAEMLERLEVIKSLTPDLEGDGIGGAINLVMKDAPDKLQVFANIASGYNALFFNRPFYTYDKNLVALKTPYELLGSNYPAKAKDFDGGLLNRKEAGFKPSIYAGLSLGNRFFKNKLGVLFAGSFQNSLRGSNSTDYSFSTATSDASNLPVLTSVNRRSFSEEQTRAGAHLKLDYRIKKNHKLQWYNALLDFKNHQVREERKTDLSVGYDPENKNYNLNYSTRFRFTHQRIINSTLKGEHSFPNRRISFDWSAVYSKASNEVPDNSTVHLATTVRNGIQNPRAVVVLGGAERRWEHNTDDDKSGYLNFKYKSRNKDLPILLTAGGVYRNKQRSNFFNQYDFRPYDETKPSGTQTNLIEGVDWQHFSEIKFTVFNPYGSTGDPLNYSASEKIVAGYLQAKLTTSKLELVTGARVESTKQGYYLKNAVLGLQNEGAQKYTDLLPSLNLKWVLNSKSNFRASYYKAINRPGFFEIVPYRIVNEELTEAGNPDLKHTVAHNADIRYEIFTGKAEQFMLGAFYKKIINPIEFGMVLQGQSSFYMPNNFGNASNYGLEIDYTRFIYYFGVKLNYTFTNSAITTSKLFYYVNPDPLATDHVLLRNENQTRRLAGQAAHVANFSMLYKNGKKGIDAQLSLAFTGDRLYAVSKYLDNDLWQGGFVQMDASAEKKVGSKFIVFAKASNLLNTPVKLYVKKINPSNEKVEGYETFKNGTMTRDDFYGQTLLIGVRFKY